MMSEICSKKKKREEGDKMAGQKRRRSLIKTLVGVCFLLGSIVLAPLGVTWTCYNSDLAVKTMRYGFAAAAGVGLLMGVYAKIITRRFRYAIIIFVLNIVVANWLLCALVSSFLCAAPVGDTSSGFRSATPLMVLIGLSTIHTGVIIRGRIMPLWYRATFAVGYSIATTSSLLIFVFTPAIARISDQRLSWIPLGVTALLSVVGVRQSWSSPRPLGRWEMVTLDMTGLFGDGKVNTHRDEDSDDAEPAGDPDAVSLERQLLRDAVAGFAPTRLRSAEDKEQTQWLAQTASAALGVSSTKVAVSSSGNEINAGSKDYLTIVQITDPHLGSYMTTEQLRTCCDRAVSLNPDLVLLTGDFFTAEAHEEPSALDWALQPLTALPTGRLFACYGNHDLETPAVTQLVDVAMKSIGARLLRDESTIVETSCGNIEMVGINYHFPHLAPTAIEQFFANRLRPSPRFNVRQTIIMLHDPSGFEYIPKNLGALVFSGHTHGGHIGLYSFGLHHATLLRMIRLCDNGLWVGGGNALYIHRGQGARSLMSQAVVRLGVPSEDSVVRLKLAPRPNAVTL